MQPGKYVVKMEIRHDNVKMLQVGILRVGACGWSLKISIITIQSSALYQACSVFWGRFVLEMQILTSATDI